MTPSLFTLDKLEYNAQSPDEEALVSAARNFGYAFKVRILLLSSVCIMHRVYWYIPYKGIEGDFCRVNFFFRPCKHYFCDLVFVLLST